MIDPFLAKTDCETRAAFSNLFHHHICCGSFPTMTSSQAGRTPVVTRSDLAADLTALLGLSGRDLASLLVHQNDSVDSPAPTLVPAASASTLHADYSTSTATPDTSVALSAAYLREMQDLQRSGLERRLAGLGEGIDRVRERGEGVQGALAEVKL